MSAVGGAALLEVSDLRVTLPTRQGRRTAVDGVSFTLDEGAIVGIAGESGSGKTMTALSFLGLLPHGARTTGSAHFEGTELLSASAGVMRRLRGRQIAMVSQDPMTALHPMLSVQTQLTEHMRYHLHLGKSQARSRALELLDLVRIPDPEGALSSYPGQFSGGMRQRIAIAVALACEPSLLIADEPTTALDVTVQAGILALLDRLRRERRLSIVVITHDLGVLSALADRLVVMYGGKVVEDGPTSSVLQAPRHPYTRGLLDALPHPEGGHAALRPITGAPPTLGQVPPGCAFHPRCPHALAGCATDVPELVTLPGDRLPGDRLLACPVDPLRAPAGAVEATAGAVEATGDAVEATGDAVEATGEAVDAAGGAVNGLGAAGGDEGRRG